MLPPSWVQRQEGEVCSSRERAVSRRLINIWRMNKLLEYCINAAANAVYDTGAGRDTDKYNTELSSHLSDAERGDSRC